MAKKYEPKKIEGKWQKAWAKSGIYKTQTSSKKPKSYVLDMFPYPSGEGLHVGHPKGYIATDIYSRYKRMGGFNVLHPMGWDAFGLPAENYALKMKTNPMVMTAKNVKRFKEQLHKIGFSYDWDREINTTDPEYYKWTQWTFLQMFKKGLAFESFEPINWCPSCKTGLALEDLENGRCERCGSVVEKKPMRQWVLKITDYAERLLKDLDQLNWPESIKTAQRNWIGKSEGAEIEFRITKDERRIKVFTTRADTLFGCTYVVLAPEHPYIHELEDKIENIKEVKEYVKKTAKETDIDRTSETKEKTGVELKGIKAINPANEEEVPVFIADYVLASYGTGAVMAVPAHDERDWDFAKKYNLPIKQAIAPYFTKTQDTKDLVRMDKKTVKRKTVYVLVYNKKTDSFLCLNWEKFGWHSGIIGGVDEGESFEEAGRREVREETGYLNLKFIKELGGEQHSHFYASHKDENRYALGQGLLFELVDEAKEEISEEETRNHRPIWIKAKEMENWLNLPSFSYIWSIYESGLDCFISDGILVNSGQFDGQTSEEAKGAITKFVGGKFVTKYKLRDWVFSRQRYWGEPIPIIHCEKCALSNPAGRGIVPVPEKDLPVKLPKVKSYEPTGTGESPLAGIAKWVNVKCPVCGGSGKRETNTMPQWAGSSWYYLRYIDPQNKKALVDKKKEAYWSPVDMYVGGTEHATRHLIYARFWHKFLYDIGVVNYLEPFTQLKNQGLIAGSDGRKMSKRWGNVINPDDIVAQYGADSLRVYEMFMGPFEQGAAWSTESLMGSRRFLDRVFRQSTKISGGKNTAIDYGKFETLLHKTIKKVGEDINQFAFNTAISSMMILVNEMDKQGAIQKGDWENFLKIMAPFAPHLADELWAVSRHKKSIHLESWPKFDENKIKDRMINIIIQVNGKVRDEMAAEPSWDEEKIKKIALSREAVGKWVGDKEVKRVIYVNGKLVNIVI